MHSITSRILLGATVGITVLTLALGTAASAANENTNASPRRDGVCMQAAVEKRDTAILAAVDAFHASWSATLTTRMNALKEAWGMSDVKARREAIKATWKTFRASHKAEIKTFHTARKAAWSTFMDDQRACKVSGTDKTTGKIDTLEPKL